MNALLQTRTWLSALIAGLFILGHTATVRPRILLVERFAPMRPSPAGRPRPRMA